MEFLFEFLFSPLPTSALVFLFGLGAVALTYLNSMPKPLRPPVDLNRQTVGIAVRTFYLQYTEWLNIILGIVNSENLNTVSKELIQVFYADNIDLQGGARKSAILKDDNLISYSHEDAKTLYEVFQRGLHASGKTPPATCTSN